MSGAFTENRHAATMGEISFSTTDRGYKAPRCLHSRSTRYGLLSAPLVLEERESRWFRIIRKRLESLKNLEMVTVRIWKGASVFRIFFNLSKISSEVRFTRLPIDSSLDPSVGPPSLETRHRRPRRGAASLRDASKLHGPFRNRVAAFLFLARGRSPQGRIVQSLCGQGTISAGVGAICIPDGPHGLWMADRLGDLLVGSRLAVRIFLSWVHTFFWKGVPLKSSGQSKTLPIALQGIFQAGTKRPLFRWSSSHHLSGNRSSASAKRPSPAYGSHHARPPSPWRPQKDFS